MLTLDVEWEAWDQAAAGGEGRFIKKSFGTLQLEHSLLSIAKWEETHHVSFLSTKNKTSEQMMDYIRCMTVNKNVDPDIYTHLGPRHIAAINEYINDPHTATTITKSWYQQEKEKMEAERKGPSGRNGEIITAELIYYWMIANNIPIEFQKWHIERLLMLIRVCAIKNAPPDKKGGKKNAAMLNASERQAMLMSRNELNARRKAQLGTTG